MLRESPLLHLLLVCCLCSELLNSFSPAPLQHTHRPCSPKSRRRAARSTNEQTKNNYGFAPWRHPLALSSYHTRNGRRRSSQTAELGDDTISWIDRAKFLRLVSSGVGLGSILSVSLSGPKGAAGFCGEPYPYWAYYIDFDEVLVPFEFQGYSGQVFARTVGNAKEQKKANHNPLVIIPGGPGLPHDYLETLEAASKDDRVVVLFDPIGTGNSSALPADVRSSAPDLLGTSSLVAQISVVLDYLEIKTYHLLGHGTAAAATLERGRNFGRSIPPAEGSKAEVILSVTLASPILDASVLPPDFLESIRIPLAAEGGSEDPPRSPLCVETAMRGRSTNSFDGGVAAMKKEARSTGSSEGIESLSCPVLITYGRRDVIGDEAITKLKESLSVGDAPVEVKRFEKSSHLAHLDEREEYVTLVQNFVTGVDKKWASARASGKKK